MVRMNSTQQKNASSTTGSTKPSSQNRGFGSGRGRGRGRGRSGGRRIPKPRELTMREKWEILCSRKLWQIPGTKEYAEMKEWTSSRRYDLDTKKWIDTSRSLDSWIEYYDATHPDGF